jgi:outer membrane protein TolC
MLSLADQNFNNFKWKKCFFFSFLLCFALINLTVRAEEKVLKLEVMSTNQQLPAPLKVSNVIEKIDFNHPTLQSTELYQKLAQAERMAAKSEFIPKYNSRTLYENFRLIKGGALDGGATLHEVSWQTPLAVELIVGVRADTNAFLPPDTLTYPINKAYLTSIKRSRVSNGNQSEIVFGARIPLLRNLLVDEFRANLKLSQLELTYAKLKFLDKRAELMMKGSEKYWDWVTNGFKLQVAEEILELAKARTDGIKERVNDGANPPIDLVEAEGQLKFREEAYIKALREFEKETIGLSAYLWDEGLNFLTPRKGNLPQSFPDPISISEDISETYLKLALKERPEILKLNTDITKENINLKLAKNNLLPKIDLELLPSQDIENFEGTTNFNGSINVQLPLYPLKAQSEILKAQTKISQNKLDLINTQAEITNEIRDALSYIQTTKDRVEQSRLAVEKLKELLEGERTKYQYGNSTLLLLNIRESAYADSKNKLYEALGEHQKALAQYRYAIGEWSIENFTPNLSTLIGNI